jgi:hypothetical protein
MTNESTRRGRRNAEASGPPRRRTFLAITVVIAVVLAGSAVAWFAIPRTHSIATSTLVHPTATGAPPRATPTPADTEFTMFNRTAETVISAKPEASGSDFIAALRAAGFTDLEVTADQTSVGLAAPSIVFAARHGNDCYLGQFTPDGHSYASQKNTPLSTGTCLIGTTAPTR